MGWVSFAGWDRRLGDAEAAACVAQCKMLYPDRRTLAAYEFFTRGCGKGSGTVEMPSRVQVSETVPEAVIVFSAPAEGIAPGGKVKLWCPNGATDPQLDNPDEPGYVQINAPVAFHAGLSRLCFREMYDQQRDWRFVDVSLPDGLAPNEKITFCWQNVKVDSRAARFDGDHWFFQIAVDRDADGYAELIPNPPDVPKVAGPAVRILVRIASTAIVGEPVRLNICAFDAQDNPATGYAGKLIIAVGQPGVSAPKNVRISGHGAVQCDVHFKKPGFYWVKVQSEDGLEAESNPVEVFAEDPGKRLYWGDLHVHTEMSADARVGAHTVSSYDGSYRIGRYQYALDFQANTDHQGVAQGNYGPDEWEAMCRLTNEANDPGRFVTLLAAELSGKKGDQNVYFSGGVAPFLDHNPADPGCREKDWAKLNGTECFLVPHHFSQTMRPWDWSVFSPQLQPVAEIFSNHGRAEFPNNDPAYCWCKEATLSGKTWVEQLSSGKLLGAIAASDDHWARPGTCGLTAIWVSELTREDVYRAVQNRCCYASTNARAILHFNVNGKEMGQAVSTDGAPQFNVRAAAPVAIQKVEIIRDGAPVFEVTPEARTAELDWNDDGFSFSAFYYVRLTLAAESNTECYMKNKQQFVWSSPVWVS
ncbi:DUF3604 domain-containing protein [Tichowtungia aerotolerans]|uniref:DUF3604 domain-containing protein n=1 Tax=Tichowtungia aerotolerans TaxID=2697043 RepID=A0A6P1MGS8_9BACT|nr:DUF3604 domain-containing protein [Tichowtungia aerotolerans]QHI70786.1 DUF3604 domain-containing protein [Tichowtungia aerotolerans]